MAKILGVGIATLDIINTVERFPGEDEEIRAIAQTRTRGGNVTNTLVVLSQLGHQVTWAGTLADDENSHLIRDDLAHYSVDISPVQIIQHGLTPTSYVTLNQQNGSRTIVHYRDLDEYSFESFKHINLTDFDWLHFEGRNVEQTRLMLDYARQKAPEIPRSVEIEKPRPGIGELCGLAELLLYSRSYAQGETGAGESSDSSDNGSNPMAFLENRFHQVPAADHVCTWGEVGAYGISRAGSKTHVPADKPAQIIDTLGAGDTFMAGLIHGKLAGMNFTDTLNAACTIAGQKCGQQGFDGLTHRMLQTRLT